MDGSFSVAFLFFPCLKLKDIQRLRKYGEESPRLAPASLTAKLEGKESIWGTK